MRPKGAMVIVLGDDDDIDEGIHHVQEAEP